LQGGEFEGTLQNRAAALANERGNHDEASRCHGNQYCCAGAKIARVSDPARITTLLATADEVIE
jgi:hypothetical protein